MHIMLLNARIKHFLYTVPILSMAFCGFKIEMIVRKNTSAGEGHAKLVHVSYSDKYFLCCTLDGSNDT